MNNIKNAFDYHKELSELKALMDSIEYTLEYVDSAFSHVKEDEGGMINMSLSLAQADLNKSLASTKKRHDDIISKLSSSYF